MPNRICQHSRDPPSVVLVSQGTRNNRHAYATHQLAAGLGVERLQRLMGHTNIHTTLRYVHWLPSAEEGAGALDLIAALEVEHD